LGGGGGDIRVDGKFIQATPTGFVATIGNPPFTTVGAGSNCSRKAGGRETAKPFPGLALGDDGFRGGGPPMGPAGAGTPGPRLAGFGNELGPP